MTRKIKMLWGMSMAALALGAWAARPPLASAAGRMDAVARLSARVSLAQTGDVNRDLAEAASKGRTTTVQKLLDAGASPDARGAGGAPAIVLASKNGYADTVQALVAKNANLESTDATGSTALIVASNFGHERTVQALLGAGAKVNAKRRDGATALSLAQKHGFDEIVALLQAAGAK
jgi:ankyrin repeat protein